MIVDVEVPSMDNVYDFRVNEESQIREIIDGIVDMICQKEKCSVDSGVNVESLLLCRLSDGGVCNPDYTVKECGIKSGDRMILV